MIFIPRPEEDETQVEEHKWIELKTKQVERNAYEFISPEFKELDKYEPILDMLLQITDNRLFLAVEWVKKRNSIILLIDNLESTLQTLVEKGIKMNHRLFSEKPWELFSDSIVDRTEFEGLSDLIAKCVTDIDDFYLCFDWRLQRNCMLWTTNQPNERLKCLQDQGEIRLSPS